MQTATGAPFAQPIPKGTRWGRRRRDRTRSAKSFDRTRTATRVRATREGDAIYVLHPDHDRFYALDGVDADVWSAIEHGEPIEEQIPALARKYGVDVERVREDIWRFVTELLAAGLFVIIPPPDAAADGLKIRRRRAL